MTKRKVFFPSFDGTYQLAGVLTYPGGDPRFHRPGHPVALLLSGWRGNKDSKRSIGIAENLAEAGIASLRFDFQGHGESGGDIHRASVTTGVRDAFAAARFLKNHARKVDMLKFGCAIVGVSVGGSVALAWMARFGHLFSLRAGVLVSCRSDYRSNIKPGTYSFTDRSSGERVVNRVMMRTGRSYDFYALAGGIGCATLVLHGTEDKTVPFAQSKKLVEGRENFRLFPIEGGDHVLRGGYCSQVIDLASQHIIRFLKPPLG